MNDPNVSVINDRVLKILYGNNNANLILNGDIPAVFDPTVQSTPSAKGKEYLHNLYPDEFEYYACAFELIDSLGVSKFFTFPVMPENLDENKPTNSSIKKTQGGVVVNNNPTFKPFDINLTGNFGRKFRRLIKIDGYSSDFELNQNSSSLINDNPSANDGQGTNFYSTGYFDSDYKTGYGNIKILEKIIETAKGQDDSFLPYKLIFYNFSLNSNYLVEPLNIRLFQNDRDKNMIWSYNLNLKAIAPAESLFQNGRFGVAGRLQTILSFVKKNSDMSSQAIDLKNLLTDNNTVTTEIEQILGKQISARALQGLSTGQRSALQAITQLTANPNSIDDFIVNLGQGILTRN